MSLLKWTFPKSTYSYHLLKKPDTASINDNNIDNENDLYHVKIKTENQDYIHEVKGRMTNEAPAKYVIDKLNNDHNQRLDRIVMICSEAVRKKITQDKSTSNEVHKNTAPDKSSSNEVHKNTAPDKSTSTEVHENTAPDKSSSTKEKEKEEEEKKKKYEAEHTLILNKDESVFRLTHIEYFKRVITAFAENINTCYKDTRIDFKDTSITNFSDETNVIKAVIDSASKVVEDYEDVNLYIDFNGGPRNVAVLIMGLSHLMKLRNVTIKEIMYMDFENKKNHIIPIENMDALFGCTDLVSGVNEYVNYGRIHILKNYFNGCKDEKIKIILRDLEDFSNNMQLCLTDYVMENKEKIKNALKQYQNNNQTSSSYEIMFSFVAEDILRGCNKLLEGTLPDIILWCIEKDFIQQALTFYIELLPAYLWENKIFFPTLAEEQDYAGWRIDREYGLDDSSDDIPYNYLKLSRHMDDKYYWMHYYKDCATGNTDGSLLEETSQKADYMLSLLSPEINRAGKSEDIDTDTLRQILTEYYLIHSQRISSRHSTTQLGNTGNLWSYQEMHEALKKAVLRLSEL